MIYGKIMNLRNALFDRGVFASHLLGAKTVSVGNITVGGTGKTPLVAFIAEILLEKGETVCILSRGYGRENAKRRVVVADGEKILADACAAGDEPFELANKLHGKAVIIADANRVAAAKFALEKFGVTAFVLDDAFQHRQARRDLNIVCIDAANPFGNRKMLPFGILREPLENLRRADAVVVTRANLAENARIIENLKAEISKYADCPVFAVKNKISSLVNLEDFPSKSKDQRPEIKDQNAFAFCALGNPENFFRQLADENFRIVSTRKFSDHHFYKQNDVREIEKTAREKGAEVLLTTAKDAVKLKDLQFEFPCFVVENAMLFEDEAEFGKLLENFRLNEIYK